MILTALLSLMSAFAVPLGEILIEVTDMALIRLEKERS